MRMLTYSKEELLIAGAARELADSDVVFVGIGLPNKAANLAKRLHAPRIQLVYESGVYGAMPDRSPLSIGDPCLVVNSLAVHSMADLFLFYLQAGLINVGFLGAAQIDRYGNINTTVIGDYHRPKVRLPGSGGACEIALLTERVIVMLPQTARSFPPSLDFITSAGQPPPGTSDRRGWGRFRSMRIITDMAVFGFDETSREMELVALHPGAELADVRRHMGWEPRLAKEVVRTPPPTAEELEILREVIVV